MNNDTELSNRLRRFFVWGGLLAVLLLIAVQLAGASPVAQDDNPPPGLDFPGLGVSGPPIKPVIINQMADPVRNAVSQPEIDVWYGSSQNFGQNGDPQQWIDILGTVSVPADSRVQWLRYCLNEDCDEPKTQYNLQVGPDRRRLEHAGDFHIELDIDDLRNGANELEIELKALNVKDPLKKSVLVNYSANNSWPLNTTINFASANNPQDVAQVVDGEWVIEGGKLQLANGHLGYDRLVTVGQFDQWQDYEAKVPFTIRGISADGFKQPSTAPGIGAIVRWQGYFQVSDEQPRVGWQNLGALAWNRYDRKPNGQIAQGLQMIGYSKDGFNVLDENPIVQLEFDVPYFFKISVDSINGAGDMYRFKVWRQDEPEPYGWDMEEQGHPDEPTTGSLALIAHHVDVEFGNVEVKPIPSGPTFQLNVTKEGNGNLPTVTPNQALYNYGDQVTITPLPTFGNELARWTGDARGGQDPLTIAITGDANINAVYVPENYGTLTVGVNNGSGSVVVSPNRSQYLIGELVTVRAIPDAGYKFDRWFTEQSANEPAANTLFTNPYSFVFGTGATNVSARFVLQDTYTLNKATTGTGSGSIVTAPDRNAFFENTVVEVRAVPDPGAVFVDWDGAYSGQSNPFFILMDGNKSVSANFEQVTDTYTLDVQAGANGTVLVQPEKEEYLYGELVTLTAVGDPGYMLGSWSGDLAGNTNPITFGMFGDYVISASFIEATNPVSDDFNRCIVDNGQWTVSDPVGDSTFQMTGTQLEISVPAGSAHNYYKDVKTAPRVMTAASDEDDLGLEVKFDSPLSQKYQTMGILVEENANTYMRFDFYYDNSVVKVFAAAFENNVLVTERRTDIAASQYPIYMQVQRDGNVWKQSYSFTGANWIQANRFTFDLAVSKAGIFVANPQPAAAFKGVFDYFFNAAQPIVPQDTNKLTVSAAASPVNGGTVTVTPEKATYACGEKVTFEAKPAEGWRFIGWAGDLSDQGTKNPATLTVSRSHQVTARFWQGDLESIIFLPVTIKK